MVAGQSESSIEIAASADRIMDVIGDFESYPRWLPAVTAAKVLTWTGGQPETVRMILAGGPVHDECTLRFRWPDQLTGRFTLVTAGLLRSMDGWYELEPLGEDTTTVIYSLSVELNEPDKALQHKAEEVIIELALTGLKRRVEG